MTYQQILYEIKDRIATITLNRPERMNTWTDVMSQEVYEAMHAAAKDRQVRVIVLTGAGRAFCAGADVGTLGEDDPKALLHKLPRPFDMNRRADYQTRHTWHPSIPKPIIAMLNGATAGLGLVNALSCDVRFAAEDAVFTTAFGRIGLSAEYGIAWMLARTVGHANALDLLISGRKVAASEAQRLGLVNFVHPRDQLADATYAYARELVDWCSPRSMRAIKQQVWEAPFQTLAEAVTMANRDMVIGSALPDFKEGLSAFLEKRKPGFTDE